MDASITKSIDNFVRDWVIDEDGDMGRRAQESWVGYLHSWIVRILVFGFSLAFVRVDTFHALLLTEDLPGVTIHDPSCVAEWQPSSCRPT